MKHLRSIALVGLALSGPSAALADEVTLIAPGGMRCAIDRMTPEFEKKTGHMIKATIGSGGGTHQQVVGGQLFDVPIVQPPYQDVIASGHVVAGSETPLATVPMVRDRLSVSSNSWPTSVSAARRIEHGVARIVVRRPRPAAPNPWRTRWPRT